METEFSNADKTKAANARLRADTEDLNNEIAGRETGRQARFGVKSRDTTEMQRKKSERAFRDAMDRLLQDREYRLMYEGLGHRLSEAEFDADNTMANIQAALRVLEDQIADMEDRAAKTLDGRPVFRTTDGRVVGAGGEEIAPEIAAGIQWPPNAPSAEEYFGALEQREALTASLDEWQTYRNDTLGNIRHRYDDRDNPMSKHDMQDALEALDAARPEVVSLESVASTQDAELSLAPAAFPKIGG